MKKSKLKLIYISYVGTLIVNLLIINNIALAQFRGQDSQQFFDQGNQLIEQQIQEMQRDKGKNSATEIEFKEDNLNQEKAKENSDHNPNLENTSPSTSEQNKRD